MRRKREKKQRQALRPKTPHRWLLAACVLLTICLVAFGGYTLYAYMQTTFPKDAVINGVKVEGCTATEATKRLQKRENHITLEVEGKTVTMDVAFEYDTRSILTLLRRSYFDPRVKKALTEGKYRFPLAITGGEKETEKLLKKAKLTKGDRISKDAYIDISKMEIVSEIYGNELEYDRLTKALKTHIEKDGGKRTPFLVPMEKYAVQPTVKSSDPALREELEFDKKYIAKGLKIRYEDGGEVTAPPEEVAKIIRYSKTGPKYLQSGAIALADRYIAYKPSKIRIQASDGAQSVKNYGMVVELKKEEVAEELYRAAASGTPAELGMNQAKETNSFSILEIKKGEGSGVRVLSGGNTSGSPIKCAATGTLEPGLYQLAEKQDALGKGILKVDTGGEIAVSPAENADAVYQSILDAQTKKAYVYIR